MKMKVITETNFENLKVVHRGKVRDIYDLGETLLFVATDRISAFDVVFNEGIPYKGYVLTQLSLFWFDVLSDICKNHLITSNVAEYPKICHQYESELEGRSLLVKKVNIVPIECIVRGYLSGSGWNEYCENQSICEIELPHGLIESQELPNPIFTPSTKAEIGKHDLNIPFLKVVEILGVNVAEELREKTIKIYNHAAAIASQKGIIIADTKLEFGILDGKIILADEVLTPDSSRFWLKDKYIAGKSQDSLDKQFLRDYLLSINFNKQPPAPALPKEIIQTTSQKYIEILNLLTA
ncbi:MAG: phosphoribosylaminoimidazolesuccinocarboxamide synthase [Ignavibacteria bacterium]|nr:phosphoribosylaminoimidazolesuccinocarboxamide synthase [Ignavibacteria bacterium]